MQALLHMVVVAARALARVARSEHLRAEPMVMAAMVAELTSVLSQVQAGSPRAGRAGLWRRREENQGVGHPEVAVAASHIKVVVRVSRLHPVDAMAKAQVAGLVGRAWVAADGEGFFSYL